MPSSVLTRRLSRITPQADADGAGSVPIGPVAARLKVTGQTLRLYEAHGLVKPARRGRERAYSPGDIQWLSCLRRLIHAEKVSIEGVKRLLRFAPCWEITGRRACPGCPVFRNGAGGPALRSGGRRRVRVA